MNGAGWAGQGCGGWGLVGGWGGLGLGWVKRELVYQNMERLCPDRKNELSDGQQQQAISVYSFLEGLGFRVQAQVPEAASNSREVSLVSVCWVVQELMGTRRSFRPHKP